MWEIPAGAGAIIAGSNRLGVWADAQLEPDAKSRLARYLKSGDWASQVDAVFASLQLPFERLFGSAYISSKAAIRSVELTLLITLPILFYYYFTIWIPQFWGTYYNILDKPSLFVSETWHYFWYNAPRLCIAIVIDFLSVMRVRFLIGRLSRVDITLFTIVFFTCFEIILVFSLFWLTWDLLYDGFINVALFPSPSSTLSQPTDFRSLIQWQMNHANLYDIFNDFRIALNMRSLQSVYFYSGFGPSVWFAFFALGVVFVKLGHLLSPRLVALFKVFRLDNPLSTLGTIVGVLLASVFTLCVWI